MSRPGNFDTNSTGAGTQDRLTELHLDLALRTSEASGGSRKAINGQPGGQSEDDQSQTPADAGMNVLVSLLSAPSAGTSALHFTLAPLLHAALSKLCKKLVSAFPLCFNARWLTVRSPSRCFDLWDKAERVLPVPSASTTIVRATSSSATRSGASSTYTALIDLATSRLRPPQLGTLELLEKPIFSTW